MLSRWFLPMLSVWLSAGLVFSGCAKQAASTSLVDAVENNAQVESDPVTEIKTVELASFPADTRGMVYQKVAAKKVMGDGGAFNVYTDAKAPDNHYTPSGWMGDYGDLKVNDRFSINPHSGSTSLQVVYGNKSSQGARWAGIYWQNPANNWGNRPGGYDLTGARQLTFWVRGEKGGERIEEFKAGGITGEFGDSDVAGVGPVTLTEDWQQVTIDLTGKDLSSISGGFCWSTNLDVNPEGATFYLDDIRYE